MLVVELCPWNDARATVAQQRVVMDSAAGDTREGGVQAPHGRGPPAARPQASTPERSAKARHARRAPHTLFAAWGHEPPVSAQPRVNTKAAISSAPLPRLVRGTSQGEKTHPFFAQREAMPRESLRRKDDAPTSSAARFGTLPAPWPTAETMHVQPCTQPLAHKRLEWPRRSARTRDHTSTRASLRLLEPAEPAPGNALACEAALAPWTETFAPAGAPTPRPPLAYVRADLARPCQGAVPPVVQHLLAQLNQQGPLTLTTRRASTYAHDSLWTDRWRPTCAAHVLGNESNAAYLRDWLRDLRVTQAHHRSRKRGRAPEPDSDDEFLPDDAAWFDQFRAPTNRTPATAPLSHCIVLEGPTGVGKTAAVYACAQELDFEVFELFAGLGRRSGKDLASAVGQLTRNHMVRAEKHAAHASTGMPPQSLILLDEADLLFDDDAGFWPAVVDLVRESRRPVVLTCTEATSLPLADLGVQRVLTWTPPAPEAATTYLQLVALAEGYIVSQATMHALYTQTQPRPVPLDRTSGPVLPTAHLYPYDRVYEQHALPAYDLRAALMQLAWLCLHTRASDVLRGTQPLAQGAAPSAPTGDQDAWHALRRVASAAERRSCMDLFDKVLEVCASL